MHRGLLRTLLTCMLLLLCWAGARAAAPVAGTVISNTALASFVDTASGTSVRLVSNTVNTRVAAKEALTLASDQALALAPGVQLALGHVLTNTGNVLTTYDLRANTLPSSAFVPLDLAVVHDVNRNGRADDGEPQIGAAGLALAPGAEAQVLVTGIVPASAGAGRASQVELLATSRVERMQARNVDTLTVTTGASPQVTLAASVASTRPGDTVEWHLTVTNNGNLAAGPVDVTIDGAGASTWLVRMAIPGNTVFAGADAGTPAGARLLYHLAGAAADSYVSALPAGATVDAVAFAHATLPPGTLVQGRLRVTVNGNAAGRIRGIARSDWTDAGARRLTGSNAVVLGLPERAPTIRFYATPAYGTTAIQATAGRPLWVQADAAMCNADPLRPDTVPVTVASQLSADVEVYTAVETAANTGLFRIQPDVPTANAALQVVAAGNGVLEVLRNDTVSATITSCGSVAARASTDLLIDPSGVVYDSRSNLPLAGATVELVDVTGAGNGGRAGEAAVVFAPDGSARVESSIVTGADGVFTFPLVRPSTYRLRVAPPRGFTFPSALPVALQPAGRVIEAAGSFGRNFRLADRPVNFDVPVDTGGSSGLVVEKRANKGVAEVGGFVDYTVRVANTLVVPLPQVEVLDALPAGFAYVRGSARLGGAPLADPQAAGGGQLRFALGTIAPGASAVLGYRVHLGAGSLGGSGINTARASGGGVGSNTSSARVQVVGGVFADDAYVIGKVYADCNRSREQDAGEPGIPGVRIYLEDGTYAVTDEEGKYSLYGLTPRTRVAKVDRTTLPAGAALQVLDQRNGGDAGSRFVDLTHGELHKADFAVAGCGAELQAQVEARRRGLAHPSEMTQAASLLLSSIPPSAVDARTLPSAGTVGLPGASPAAARPSLGAVGDAGGSHAAALQAPGAPLYAAPPKALPAAADAPGQSPQVEDQPLEALLPQLSPDTAFINLREGQVLPSAQTRVRVKGPLGATFALTLNGEPVPHGQVGKRSSLEQNRVAAWEYIGVDLRPGRNTLAVSVQDPFGNTRGRAEVTVLAPGPLARVRVGLPDEPVADAASAFAVDVRLEDAGGLPVTARTRVTLQASAGQWQVTDADPAQAGTQAFIEGGQGQFLLLPPAQPGPLEVTADAGLAKGRGEARLVPNLRPLVAAGIVEGAIHLRNLDPSALQPAQRGDTFERQIRSLSRSFDGGRGEAGLRSSVFLKGKVLGSSLLTLAYDSDKPDTRLLRDIQPDRFYPVYGDSSARGFEAQSTGRLYVLLQNGSNYALIGDFTTQTDNAARQLTQYARALHGAKGRWSNGTVTAEGFASRTSATQLVQEFRANGTSGPFRLDADIVANSEQVRILVRGRDQLARILEEKPLERFVDYSIDPASGLLLLKDPVPSVDADLNPVFVRIAYDVDKGGPEHTVAGAEVKVQVLPGVTVGALAVRDDDPANAQQLQGLTLEARLADKTVLTAEAARSRTELQGEGSGQRVELRHEQGALQAHAWAARTDAAFYNPGSPQSAGQAQHGAKAAYALDEGNRVVLEALRTTQGATGARQAGAELRLEHSLGGNARLEVGVRHSRSNAQAAASGPALPGTAEPVVDPVAPLPAGQPDDMVGYTSARVKLTVPVPALPEAEVFASAEYAIDGSGGREVGVGANYALNAGTKLYLRHNFISSLNGPYTLSTDFARYSTVVGVDTVLPDTTQLFNEYRVGDGIDGRGAEAAVGLRRTFRLDNGLGITGGLQRIKQLGGAVSTSESTAVSLGVDYAQAQDWKGSAQVQWQDSDASRSRLLTAAVVQKLGAEWTVLHRGLYHTEDSAGGGARRLVTAQSGAAYRPVDSNRWNALARIEYRDDQDSTLGPGAERSEKALILSTHLNVQPTRDWLLRARLAAKRAQEDANGLSSASLLRLAGLRATWDIASRWDVGLQGFRLWGEGAAESALGLELGYMVTKNLWVSVGYNFRGFDAADLAGEATTRRGAYLRMRYKFDESLLGAEAAAAPAAAEKAR